MTFLRDLITNLAVLVLVLVGLEWLLPPGDLRRVVKVVMGLVVIATLLNPIVSLLSGGLFAGFGVSVSGVAPSTAYQERGQRITQAGEQVVLRQWQQDVEAEASDLVQSLEGVLAAQVMLQLDPGISFVVRVTTTGDVSRAGVRIEPIDIQIGPKITEKQPLDAQIRQLLSTVYRVDPKDIHITYEGE
ncbi:MAG: stage III sporulation protein AF [Limnochordia bacterium]|jgi:stage III sporulation protein AF|nr:stage III sporulation protein AF [Limnochordia bacterium]